ncbi:MAG: prolyl-tRNA synthetase, partial [Parcubacteria group bacterium GW2011_GWA2_51_12]
MRQSQLFTKTLKEDPKDETSVNAKFLERGGFVYKNSAGIYSFLPLGNRVIQKIAGIIREEMNAIGGQEMLMAGLHDKKYLTATGRWDVDVVFKVLEGGKKEPSYNISWTHEEIIAEIATKYVSSYKDLPFSAYQF